MATSSIDPDHPLVAALRDAAESETGSRPGTIGVPYGCDMALWRREAGAACAVYGPGDIAHAHAVDERVSIAEVAATARVLEAAVRRLLR